jgi:putative ABC transport system permease protein
MRNWRAEVRQRLESLDIPPTRLASIAEEVGQHLEQRCDRLIAQGVPPDAADRAVLQELSDSDVLRQEVRQIAPYVEPDAPVPGSGGRSRWVESLWQDIRYGARSLRRNPGFTLVAALTLALGVGANTAIFTVANTVMLRPLPFQDPGRLVRLWESNPEKGWPTFSASHPTFLDWRSESRAFERLAAVVSAGFTLTSGGAAEIVRANAVTADFLPLLGTAPVLGRNFRPDEDRPGGRTNVAIVTSGFWQRRLGSNPAVLGTSITLDGRPFDIIGVLPESFLWGDNRFDLLVPLAPDPARARGDHRLLVIGRLASGVSIDQARTEMNGIAARIAKQFPASNGGWSVRISGFYDWLVPQAARDSVTILMGAVGLLLLIACGNVASLMLARTASREKEISIRVALGADRLRIVLQLLVEATLVALIAGSLGLLGAWSGTRLLISAGPAAGLPRLNEISFDARVLAFTLAMAVLSGLIFGLIPALHASRPQVNDSLKESSRGGTGGATRHRLRSALIVGEVALSVALLIAAGLLVRSFRELQHVDPGFQIDRLATMRVNLPRPAYNTGAKSKAFYERLLPALAALPGVQSVATSSGVPLSGGNTGTELSFPGRTLAAGVPSTADWRLVSPGYFKSMNIPLRGRDFDDRDVGTDGKPAQLVTIISKEMARRYWPDEDPIGRTVILHSFDPNPHTIIGVAGDVRSFGLDTDVGPMVYGSAMVYAGWNPMSLVIRSAADPLSHVEAIRQAIHEIDPAVPIFDVRALDDLLSQSFGSRRFNMYLLGCFAAAAAGLACVGLFGVLAYLVSQRTRDIGIRLALGATPRDVIGLIVGRGMALALSGAAIGLATAFGAARVMKTLLYSISPRDPLTFIVVPVLLSVVALVACYLPARRATRVDPLVALRSE